MQNVAACRVWCGCSFLLTGSGSGQTVKSPTSVVVDFRGARQSAMVYVKRHAVPRPDSRPDHHLRLALHIKSFGPPSSTESAQGHPHPLAAAHLRVRGGNAPAVEDSPSSHDTFHSARSHHATPGSLPFSTSQRDGGYHRQPRPRTVQSETQC